MKTVKLNDVTELVSLLDETIAVFRYSIKSIERNKRKLIETHDPHEVGSAINQIATLVQNIRLELFVTRLIRAMTEE